MSTNTPDPQNPVMQQPMWGSGTSPSEPRQPLPPLVKRGLLLLLFYLIGPVLFLSEGIQEDAAGPMWQADKRWANVNGSAFLSLLWYVPIAVFHAPLAAFWSAIFITLAHWLHLPFLAWFGGTTLFPPVPASTLLRWFLSFPLAGLLAIIRETMNPQTIWETKRVLTSDEQVEVAATITAREKKKIAATQKSSKTATTPAPKKPKPRTPAKSKDVQQPVIPKADSLWGSVDWKSVPNTHPVKQAALQEAHDLEAKQQEEKRNQWLAQQRASLQAPQSPSIVDSTLASPTPAPSSPPAQTATPEEKEYNWDEGNGSIQA